MKIELSLNKAYLFGQAVHGLNQFPAKLASDVVRKIAINMNRINDSFPDIPSIEAEMFKRHGEPKETDEGYKAYLEEKIKFNKETTVTVDLETVKFDQLNIGESDRNNHFPPEAVAALSPMIEGMDKFE